MAQKLGPFFTAAAVVFVFFSAPTFAHHGTAAFDTTKTIMVNSTVTDFEFENPHCEVYFDVTDDKGHVEKWQGELTAPNKLARSGWTKETLKPGEKVTVSGYPGKNAAHTLWIVRIIGPNGKAIPLHETTD